MLGLEPFGSVLFGVVVEEGLVVLFGLEAFVSELLEAELGDVELVPDGEVAFMSELELPDGEVVEEGEVVDEGELDVLDPVWLDEVEGVLWPLLAPLPAPLPSFPPAAVPVLVCATAIPVQKTTAVAIVRNLLRISVSSLSAVSQLPQVGCSLNFRFARNRELQTVAIRRRREPTGLFLTLHLQDHVCFGKFRSVRPSVRPSPGDADRADSQ